VGTETDGSIVFPSSVNGIVGIKPTVGLVSRSGVVPVSHSQDTPGPMARTVADAAALLTALAGADPRDAAAARARVEPDYAAFLDPGGLRDSRIGVARRLAGFNDRVDRLFDEALGSMRDPEPRSSTPPTSPRGLEDPELDVFLYSSRPTSGVPRFSRVPAIGPRDLITFNAEHADAEMPFFGQTFEQAAPRAAHEPAWLRRRHLPASRARPDAVMDEHRVRSCLPATWRIDFANGDRRRNGPAVAVPDGHGRWFAFDRRDLLHRTRGRGR
jgi:amidase